MNMRTTGTLDDDVAAKLQVGPFVAFNGAAMVETLLEAELSGSSGAPGTVPGFGDCHDGRRPEVTVAPGYWIVRRRVLDAG